MVMENGTFCFNGNLRIQTMPAGRQLANTFTYECWVRADCEMVLDEQRSEGVDGIYGRSYLLGPDYYDQGAAGCGVAVGRNGLAVYEHTENHLAACLAQAYDFSEWQHIAIVYKERKPHLYINGEFVKAGLQSRFVQVFPSFTLGGHKYGNFSGKVRELRLWHCAREENEIRAAAWRSLTEHEPGLYAYWNPSTGVKVLKGVKSQIKLSIIIPSYNRYPLNYFALRMLERQTYPGAEFEVILLDDGSSDATDELAGRFGERYHFIYVRLNQSLGRAAVRNLGIHLSSGSTLLFLDAEMLCPPAFVENHMKHHVDSRTAVVSCSMRVRRTFTFADRGFNQNQFARLRRSFASQPSATALIETCLAESVAPVQLVSEENMADRVYMDQISEIATSYDRIFERHGHRFVNFHYDWKNFITSNVSVSKALLLQAGTFDERFIGFGWEDWELGYRLKKQGARFVHDESVISYHQEHCISEANTGQSSDNFLRFLQKYELELEIQLLLLLQGAMPHSLTQINDYLADWQRLRSLYKDEYEALDNQLFAALQAQLPALKPMKLDLNESKAKEQLARLKKRADFPHLVELADALI